MASIAKDPGGFRRIVFVDPRDNSKRKTIRLGRCNLDGAKDFKRRIEAIISATLQKVGIDADTSKWLGELPDVTHARIAATGLIQPREASPDAARPRNPLGDFVDAFIASAKATKKPNTIANLEQVRRWLVDSLGVSRDLARISIADAEHVVEYMRAKGLGENTIRRHVGRARQLFKRAIKRGIVNSNPFEGMVATVRADRKRLRFISRADLEEMLAACPDNEWRLIFALSRIGGLRCPSETLALKWGDIRFSEQTEDGKATAPTIRVPQPKLEHIEGKEHRIIPMFPELVPLLLTAQSEALERSFRDGGAGVTNQTPIITRYRDGGTNLRTRATRIIRAAHLEPWPKPFHNLRASRQTELARSFPIHVVCDWIGNSRAVAQEHYLQVTDSDFQRATRDTNEAARKAARGGVQSSETECSATNANRDCDTKNALGALALHSLTEAGYPRQESNL